MMINEYRCSNCDFVLKHKDFPDENKAIEVMKQHKCNAFKTTLTEWLRKRIQELSGGDTSDLEQQGRFEELYDLHQKIKSNKFSDYR